MELNPKEWGPHVWKTIDVFVTGYGEYPDAKLRQAALQFFASLGELLPCPHCRQHYKTLLKKRPVQTVLKDSSSLQGWVKWMKGEVDKSIRERNPSKEYTTVVPIEMKSVSEQVTPGHKIRENSISKLDQSIQAGPVKENSFRVAVERNFVPTLLADSRDTYRVNSNRTIQKPVRRRNILYPPPPPSVRKRNLGKPRNIPSAAASTKTVSKSYHGGRSSSYQQQQAAKIAANWKGSKAGLQKYIRSEKGYIRPCACN